MVDGIQAEGDWIEFSYRNKLSGDNNILPRSTNIPFVLCFGTVVAQSAGRKSKPDEKQKLNAEFT